MLLVACGAPDESIGLGQNELVYDDDNRSEVYDASSRVARSLASESVVAFIRNDNFSAQEQVGLSVTSWSEVEDLCPEERFGSQPAAAFCTGVLLDWDLVLTAGHCMRRFALKDFSVAFGYYYSEPNVLTITEVRHPSHIVDERLDASGYEPRLDYAWVRLDRPIEPPLRPAAILGNAPVVAAGTSLTSISAVGGVPLKIDDGGSVIDPRDVIRDYFVADTDTASGSSGGGAFDESGALVGVLARGATDFTPTERGCRSTARVEGSEAAEQYTYASQALTALCEGYPTASSLCQQDCTDRCQVELEYAVAGGGCSIASLGHQSNRHVTENAFVWLLGLGCLAARRVRVTRYGWKHNGGVKTPLTS